MKTKYLLEKKYFWPITILLATVLIFIAQVVIPGDGYKKKFTSLTDSEIISEESEMYENLPESDKSVFRDSFPDNFLIMGKK
jgi:hypothetical protein